MVIAWSDETSTGRDVYWIATGPSLQRHPFMQHRHTTDGQRFISVAHLFLTHPTVTYCMKLIFSTIVHPQYSS